MTTLGSQYRGTREFLLVYCTLIRAAQQGTLLYYKEVAHHLGIHHAGHHMARQVGQVLGEISEDEHQAGRPMLSAIAVNEAGFPGDGFFKLARRLGKLTTQDARAEEQFLNSERSSVYATWAPSTQGREAAG
jgi:hypothetical protein